MIENTTDTDADDVSDEAEELDEITLDAAELAAMQGHAEAREELRRLGWSEDQVEELEAAAHSYTDFARCVVEERQWLRSGSD